MLRRLFFVLSGEEATLSVRAESLSAENRYGCRATKCGRDNALSKRRAALWSRMGERSEDRFGPVSCSYPVSRAYFGVCGHVPSVSAIDSFFSVITGHWVASSALSAL